MGTNDAMAYFQSGEAHYQNGETDAAIADLTQATNLDPNFARAYCLRGLAYSRIGDTKNEIANYSKAIELDSNYAAAYKNRAAAYTLIKNNVNSLNDYNTLIDKLHDTSAETLMGRAAVHLNMRNFKDAIADCNKMISVDSNNIAAYSSLGMIYAEMKDFGNAIKNLTKYLNLIGNSVSGDKRGEAMKSIACCGLGRAYCENSQYGDAIKSFSKAIELMKNNPLIETSDKVKAYLDRAHAYRENRTIDNAILDIEAALELDRDNAAAKEFLDIARKMQSAKNQFLDGASKLGSNPPQSAPQKANSSPLPVILSAVAVLVLIAAGIVIFSGGLDFWNKKTAEEPASLPQDQAEAEQSESGTGQNKMIAESAPGDFVDSRDGQKYRAVRIGNRAWMDRNLNYKPQAGRSWCYNDNASNCAKYGRLYDWNTARTVCPAGWHLPNRQEWGQLAYAAGGDAAGTALKTKNGWTDYGNGTDNYGFSALPGGSRTVDDEFKNAGNRGIWWTATEYDSDSSYYRRMGYNYDYVYEGTYGKEHGFSVRCVQ